MRDLKYILDCCGFHSDIGIRVLIDKSLLTENDGVIIMHDKLQELGMNIVRQKAPNVPARWSRIWRHDDFHSVMFEKMAMDYLKAIVLNSEMNTKENTTFRAEALPRMNQLRLLKLRNVKFSGSFNCLSKELRYLNWEKYPFTYFPSSCELINLVHLHLGDSNIKQLWEGIKPLYKLKVMSISGSESLVRTPDFNGTPNLEKLNLGSCTKLVHIHPSIGLLRKLVSLNLYKCTSLTNLPNSIFDLTSLKFVNLSGCSQMFYSKLSENARHGTSDTAVQCQSISSFFNRLKLMWPFHLHDSTSHNDIVGSQMPSLARFYFLRWLCLSFCSLLNIPEGIASLYYLEELDLRGNNFVTLPCFIKKFPRLARLYLDHCKQLTSLSEFPLNTVFPVGEKLARVELSMFDCPRLDETESLSSSALSWMIQFLKVHKESSPDITIAVPGTQVPSWFNHQSVGKSITVRSFLNVRDNNWIGIAFCAVFIAHFQPTSLRNAEHAQIAYIYCELQVGKRRHMGNVRWIHETDWLSSDSVHLCLVYFTRQELIPCIQQAKANIDSDGFSLKLVWSHFFNEEYRFTRRDFLHLEVKNCGVRVVLKHDLEDFIGDE